ncbi:hypothetical protein PORY_000475 [Pneumocystis oryctolagi]|uniref:Uncharacterized protein n=1 Tax=Pneumocystis oryctolagi TaxID=42067 RepID=A0ACB7CGV6_9ASCO|nr:hypothetical protein PORY_000475 [Pneumocystis oryctolagi]
MNTESRPLISGKSSKLFSTFRNLGRPKKSLLNISESSLSIHPLHDIGLLVHTLRSSNVPEELIQTSESLSQVLEQIAVINVTEIWMAGKALITFENDVEVRRSGFSLMEACIKAQTELSAVDRYMFYQDIQQHHIDEDFAMCLDVMRVLTNDGRDITTMESEITRLLSSWLYVCFKNAENDRLKKLYSSSLHNDLSYEQLLETLFCLITNIVKFHYAVFEESDMVMLINDVIWIGKKTTHKNNIKDVIQFLDVVIRFGYIPIPSLENCIEFLCSTNIGVLEFSNISWNIMKNLMKSHIAHNVVLSLRKFLEMKNKLHANVIVGAARFLSWILTADEQNKLSSIPQEMIMETYKSALSLNIPQVDFEILKAIRDFINYKHALADLKYDDWDLPIEILSSCSKYLQYSTIQSKFLESCDTELSDDIYTSMFQVTNQILHLLQDLYNNSCYSGSKRKLIHYFSQIHAYLPESTSMLLLDYYSTHHLCSQDCEKWLENSIFIGQSFFKSPSHTTKIKIKALSLVKNVATSENSSLSCKLVNDVFLPLFENLFEEQDHVVILECIKTLIEIICDGNDVFFNETIKILEKCSLLTFHQIEKFNSLSQNSRNNFSTLISGENIIFKDEKEIIALASTKGLITLFLYYLRIRNNAKCIQLYKIILSIVSNFEGNSDVRIAALQILVRIRADSSHFIYLTTNISSLQLTSDFKNEKSSNFSETFDKESSFEQKADLNKTKFLRKNFINDDIRSNKRAYHVLWSIPEKLHVEILPIHEFTARLRSCNINILTSETSLQQNYEIDQVLPISAWLKIIINILKNEKDWEIYLYVLVHISSQLRNKHLFCDSVYEIRELRTLIVDQLFNNVLAPVLLPDNLRKTDVMVALIDILTVLISYHNKYTKNEEDEIVASFQMGLQKWSHTAKSCIHALTICCHELPVSMSKLLSGILVKLSQLITSSSVSIHILEFLSSLARLPTVYANFTEADFRRVFGIALQYIQHSNAFTKSQSLNRSENPKDSCQISSSNMQMSQYVLTLAYNIISVWFLALKLSERRKYVAWIIRGLLLANPLKNGLDEQSQTCYDMLLRFSYSNADIKGCLTNYTPDPSSVSKTWLYGNSFVTIDTTNSSDLIELTIRRSSGTVHFSCQPREFMNNEINTDDNLDVVQDQFIENSETLKLPVRPFSLESPVFLPSYILLQLSVFPELLGQSKPYLLADNEFTKRTLSVFDRIPVVDFHKIGVVYVAPGQSTELEILSNTCGSKEYLNFVEGLGDLTRLKGNKTIYTGGLDSENDHDGEFAYFWKDKITQIIYHCCTLMPTNLETDPNCTLKKRHIGNDFVNIIFNESGSPYIFDTISGQFNFINIVISRNSKYNYNILSCKESSSDIFLVELLQKTGISEICSLREVMMISSKALPIFVRNLALHASTFSQVYHQIDGEYITNWRERLRHILRVKERLQLSDSTSEQSSNLSMTHQWISDSNCSKLFNLDNANDNITYLEKALDFTLFS